MNPLKLLQLKKAWDCFQKNHPRFQKFLDAVSKNTLQEGTVFEIKVTPKDGAEYITNLKLTKEDAMLLKELKEMFQETDM